MQALKNKRAGIRAERRKTAVLIYLCNRSFFDLPTTKPRQMTPEQQTPECCPPFSPELWHDKIFDWSGKNFIRGHVRTLWYMPLNFGKAITGLMAKVEQAGAKTPDWLCLSDHTSKWNMDILLAVDKEIAGADNLSLSGKFYSRVYEGPFRDTGKWASDFKSAAAEKGFAAVKLYMWYTTCPKCAKKYGKNHVVFIAAVA